MQVLMYAGHHSLPFWHSPKQPKGIFDSKKMKDFRNASDLKISDSWVWTILKGLSQYESNFIAHISVDVDIEVKEWGVYKRVWIQITTPSTKLDKDNLPLIVDPFNDKVLVKHIWGGDNGTGSPYDFDLPRKKSEKLLSNEFLDADFWTRFISEMIEKSKEDLEQEKEKLRQQISEIDSKLEFYTGFVEFRAQFIGLFFVL